VRGNVIFEVRGSVKEGEGEGGGGRGGGREGGGGGREGEGGGGGRAKFNVNFNIFIEQGFDPSPFVTKWNKMIQNFCEILKVKGEGISQECTARMWSIKSRIWD
jgi:hypothetical protein